MELRDKRQGGPPQCGGSYNMMAARLGHHCRCPALGTHQIPSGTDTPWHVGVRDRGAGRKGSLGCVPECASVPGLVSRVEKDAVEPEG